MNFIGEKRRQLYDEFISKFIPQHIELYVEPFAGSFAVACYIFESEISINKVIYNDINNYNQVIYADKVHHLDYKEIFKIYDDKKTVFYLDPPYYKKEYLYKGCENYTNDFHIELHNEVKKLTGKVIMSYENVPFILNLYKDFDIHTYPGTKFAFRNEIIITNF